jgi:hypothetical protein
MRFLKAKHYLEDDEERRKRYFIKTKRKTSIVEGRYDPNSGMTIPIQDRHCPIWDAAAHIYGLKRNVITVPRTVEALKSWIKDGTREQQEWFAINFDAAFFVSNINQTE